MTKKFLKIKSRLKIPKREEWLFKNKKALAQVLQGLEDSAAGRITYRGSFAKYLKK